MSYDLVVLLGERPEPAALTDFAAAHRLTLSGHVTTGAVLARNGAVVLNTDPPVRAPAAEVARLVGWEPPDPRWWVELHVPAAAGTGGRRLAHLLGRLLAARHDGFVHDPQTGAGT